MDSITPKHGAHWCAIGANDFQRQRSEIVNAGTNAAQIERFDDGDPGAGKRVVILQ